MIERVGEMTHRARANRLPEEHRLESGPISSPNRVSRSRLRQSRRRGCQIEDPGALSARWSGVGHQNRTSFDDPNFQLRHTGFTTTPMASTPTIHLAPFDPGQHLPLLRTWLHRHHVRPWWGDPDDILTDTSLTTRQTHAIITEDTTDVGYLCWEVPPDADLRAAGLTDLPTPLVDIDILIGDPERLGQGIGPIALGLLLEQFRADPDISFAGIGTSVSNPRAIRAFTGAGFRRFRRFDDPEHGPCQYMVADLRGGSPE